MSKEEIILSMLKSFSEVAPLVSLLENWRGYEGMNNFDAYQIGGITYFHNRETKQTYKLTATIENIGKAKITDAIDHYVLEMLK